MSNDEWVKEQVYAATLNAFRRSLRSRGTCLRCGGPLPDGDEMHPDCYRMPKVKRP